MNLKTKIAVFGPVGSGKSFVVNEILGRQAVKEGVSVGPVTRDFEFVEGSLEIDGREEEVVVIDTPGLEGEGKTAKRIKKRLRENLESIDKAIFVIKSKRLEPTERADIKLVLEILNYKENPGNFVFIVNDGRTILSERQREDNVPDCLNILEISEYRVLKTIHQDNTLKTSKAIGLPCIRDQSFKDTIKTLKFNLNKEESSITLGKGGEEGVRQWYVHMAVALLAVASLSATYRNSAIIPWMLATTGVLINSGIRDSGQDNTTIMQNLELNQVVGEDYNDQEKFVETFIDEEREENFTNAEMEETHEMIAGEAKTKKWGKSNPEDVENDTEKNDEEVVKEEEGREMDKNNSDDKQTNISEMLTSVWIHIKEAIKFRTQEEKNLELNKDIRNDLDEKAAIEDNFFIQQSEKKDVTVMGEKYNEQGEHFSNKVEKEIENESKVNKKNDNEIITEESENVNSIKAEELENQQIQVIVQDKEEKQKKVETCGENVIEKHDEEVVKEETKTEEKVDQQCKIKKRGECSPKDVEIYIEKKNEEVVKEEKGREKKETNSDDKETNISDILTYVLVQIKHGMGFSTQEDANQLMEDRIMEEKLELNKDIGKDLGEKATFKDDSFFEQSEKNYGKVVEEENSEQGKNYLSKVTEEIENEFKVKEKNDEEIIKGEGEIVEPIKTEKLENQHAQTTVQDKKETQKKLETKKESNVNEKNNREIDKEEAENMRPTKAEDFGSQQTDRQKIIREKNYNKVVKDGKAINEETSISRDKGKERVKPNDKNDEKVIKDESKNVGPVNMEELGNQKEQTKEAPYETETQKEEEIHPDYEEHSLIHKIFNGLNPFL